MLNFIKDTISGVLFVCRKILSNSSSLSNELGKDGILVRQQFLDGTTCDAIKNDLIHCVQQYESEVWSDDLGADKRLYGYDKVTSLHSVEEFFSHSKKLATDYLGYEPKAGFVLGAILEAKKGNKGSGGGWHRDSAFSHQFKTILYITDVELKNGPFQYVAGSHMSFSKISISDFGTGRTRYTDLDIENMFTNASFSRKVKEYSGCAGTLILADTKGLHRGSPIKQGTRVALTCYFWKRSIPTQINALLVKSK